VNGPASIVACRAMSRHVAIHAIRSDRKRQKRDKSAVSHSGARPGFYFLDATHMSIRHHDHIRDATVLGHPFLSPGRGRGMGHDSGVALATPNAIVIRHPNFANFRAKPGNSDKPRTPSSFVDTLRTHAL